MNFLFRKYKYVSIAVIIFALLIAAECLYLSLQNTSGSFVFSLQNPKNERTLIIYPGHCGEDGGAVSLTGIYESDINLAISLKLDQIMGLYGISPVMTRDSNDIDYPADAQSAKAKKTADQKNRLKLINDTENAVLISIHQNQYTSGGPFGAQVLYANTEHSQELAVSMQELLISSLNPDNYRTATQISKDIYLMNNINCPAVLVECGFLSNAKEESLLKTDPYQLKVAATIAAGYLCTYETLN